MSVLGREAADSETQLCDLNENQPLDLLIQDDCAKHPTQTDIFHLKFTRLMTHKLKLLSVESGATGHDDMQTIWNLLNSGKLKE